MVPSESAFQRPHALEELRAAEAAAVRLLALGELALDHHLGGDAGVIGARLPEHVAAAHALEAAQDVLQGVVEGVAHMQGARHVGRRDDDAEGLGRAALRAPGPEGAGLLPAGGDARLDGGGVERLVHHGAKPVGGARRADRRARKPSGPAKSTRRPARRCHPRPAARWTCDWVNYRDAACGPSLPALRAAGMTAAVSARG